MPDPPRPVPAPLADASDDAAGSGTIARRLTEPLRELSALALLAGNAVLLFLGFARLFLVSGEFAQEFGIRCVATFPGFAGPVALGLPILSVILATHVAPMVPRYRLVLAGAFVQYGISALFGLITFIGAFIEELPAARATLEGLLGRSVWLGLLVLGGAVLARLWTGLFPASGDLFRGRADSALDEPTLDTGLPLITGYDEERYEPPTRRVELPPTG